MVDMLSRYAKYVFSNKKEVFILLAQWFLAAICAYASPKWDTNPIITGIGILSTMVLLLTLRIKAMYTKLGADK